MREENDYPYFYGGTPPNDGCAFIVIIALVILTILLLLGII